MSIFIPGQLPGIFCQSPVDFLPVPLPPKKRTRRSVATRISLIPVRRCAGAAILIPEQRAGQIHPRINDPDQNTPSPLPQLRGTAHLHHSAFFQLLRRHQSIHPGDFAIVNVLPLPGKRF